jgi:hypothetical protein
VPLGKIVPYREKVSVSLHPWKEHGDPLTLFFSCRNPKVKAASIELSVVLHPVKTNCFSCWTAMQGLPMLHPNILSLSA